MTDKAPGLATVEIHNKLISISVTERDEILRLLWQLLAIKAKQPSTFAVRQTLAQAYAKLGQREDAAQETMAAYHLRSSAEQGLPELAESLVGIGDIQRASEVVHELQGRPDYRGNPHAQDTAALVAVLSGDVTLLQRAAALESPNHEFATQILGVLTEAGLLGAMSDYFAILRRVFLSRATIAQVVVDDAPGTVAVRFYIPLPQRQRIELRKLADTELLQLREKTGLSGFATALAVIITGIPTQGAAEAA